MLKKKAKYGAQLSLLTLFWSKSRLAFKKNKVQQRL